MRETETLYVDDNGNSWSKSLYTKEQAVWYSAGLVDCHGCHDCSDCSDCHSCRNCHNCHNCHSCSNCHDCRNCRNCHGCHGCHSYETNPERIVSPKLGSRNDHTTVYWVDANIQVVCGCFRGDLNTFEQAVYKKYGNAHEYHNFIRRVRAYMNS